MGPTNVALVTLYQTELALREAQGHLEAATKNVRIQERRVSDLTERLRVSTQQLKELQVKGANLDLDIKTRDARIEKLRTQQANAKNNKEYQAFLIEINTEKVDKAKSEDESMKVMESVEKDQASLKEMQAQLETEKSKLDTMRAEITDTIARLTADVDALRPAREQAAAAVPQRARQEFDRLADRFEGEVLSALYRPDPRREEYVCSACNMELVLDVYNRLHTRDEMVFCPSCRRMLYIPADLPPEVAVKQAKKEREPREPKEPKAPRRPPANPNPSRAPRAAPPRTPTSPAPPPAANPPPSTSSIPSPRNPTKPPPPPPPTPPSNPLPPKPTPRNPDHPPHHQTSPATGEVFLFYLDPRPVVRYRHPPSSPAGTFPRPTTRPIAATPGASYPRPEQDMPDARTRSQIALLAARLMYDRSESEYFTAKRKAARQLGLARTRPGDLPSNAEIRDQIQSLAKLYEGDSRTQNLRAMRLEALRMMRLLSAFHPHLIGSVLTGHTRRGSDIDLHLFSNHPSAVTTVLEDERLPHTLERKRVLKHNEERIFTHVHVQTRFNIELTLYTTDKVNYPFKSSITGKLIERATTPELESLLRSEDPTLDLDPDSLHFNDDADDREDPFSLFRTLLAPLEHVKQNPAYHPEGDALYHSLQAFELARDTVPYDEEFILAALLHDVGKAIDPHDHTTAALQALEGAITDRTAFLIQHHMDAHLLHNNTLGHRARQRLQSSEHYEDLVLLGEIDRAARTPGAQVSSLDHALSYLQSLNPD